MAIQFIDCLDNLGRTLWLKPELKFGNGSALSYLAPLDAEVRQLVDL